MKTPVSIILISLILLIACTKSNKGILKGYTQAHNNHNIEKSMDFYTDDIEFELVGTWIKKGKAKIKELEEWDAAINSNLNFTIIKESGDTIICNGIEKNDWFNAIGLSELNYDTITFVFKENKIKKIIAKPAKQSNEALIKKMTSLMQWAAINDSLTIAELLPKDEFVYSRTAAKKWLNLIERWNKS